MKSVTGDFDDLIKKLGIAQKRLPTACANAIRRAALKGVFYAKAMAPRRRGILHARIVSTPVIIQKKIISAEIQSTVDKPFPYHFWVNETRGYKLIRQRARFGDKKKYPYSAMKGRTGTPGYFHKTAERLKKEFPAIMVKEVTTVLKQVKN